MKQRDVRVLLHGYAVVAHEPVWGIGHGKLPGLRREIIGRLSKPPDHAGTESDSLAWGFEQPRLPASELPHILAFEGESKVTFFDGSSSECEGWRTQQFGDAATWPHRITYRKLTR